MKSIFYFDIINVIVFNNLLNYYKIILTTAIIYSNNCPNMADYLNLAMITASTKLLIDNST